jgi:hypothetical protein
MSESATIREFSQKLKDNERRLNDDEKLLKGVNVIQLAVYDKKALRAKRPIPLDEEVKIVGKGTSTDNPLIVAVPAPQASSVPMLDLGM